MNEIVFSIEPSLDKTLEIEVPGWEPKMTVKYSIDFHAGISYLCWKIQETDQVFRIPATTVYQKHGMNFAEHFSLTLKVFREDYKEWESQSFPEDWMKRYYTIFHHLIK
jgi:hypothetical protein